MDPGLSAHGGRPSLRIEHLRSERYNGLVRVPASVVWEDAHRPAQEIYVATEEPFGRDLAANADVFTVAASCRR